MPRLLIALDGDNVPVDYSLAYASAWERAFGTRPTERDPGAYWPMDRWDVERLTAPWFQRAKKAHTTVCASKTPCEIFIVQSQKFDAQVPPVEE